MYTIQQDSANKLVIPFNGTDYDFLLIVFTYSCYESVGVFENTAGTGCDYEIVVNEVGENGTADPENGDVKISPRSTWKGDVYGQDNNVNLFPQYAALIEEYKFQVKGNSCNVYPNLSPQIDCPPATAIVQDQDGNELARENIASGATGIIPVDVGGGVLYTYPYDSFNTGQDISYATGDDKDIRDTVFTPEILSWDTSLVWSFPVLNPADFTKLLKGSNPDGSGTNIFGNLERFTDENGLQVYGNNYIIDHLTGEGIYFDNTLVNRNDIQSRAFSASLNVLGFSDFHRPNAKEIYNVLNGQQNDFALNYNPFNSTLEVDIITQTRANNSGGSSNILRTFKGGNVLTTGVSGVFYNDINIAFRKAFTYNPTTKQMDLT